MEIPISDKPYSILMGYNGTTETKNKINRDAQNGIDTIVIGNLTDATIFKKQLDCIDDNLRKYVATLNGYAKRGALTYIPGEHDLEIYTELYDIMDECKGRKNLSKVTSWSHASKIMKIAEKIQEERPELMGVYQELSNLAIYDPNNFLYLIKSLIVLGKQPIYSIREVKNNDGTSVYYVISHANPQGKKISKEVAEELASKAMTIEDVAATKLNLSRNSQVGTTHNRLKATVDNALINYLLNPDDIRRKKITSQDVEDR